MINSARACSVTGHRIMEKDIENIPLKETFIKLIKDGGYDTFLIGMALGFDTLCFQVLEKIREEENIKLIACVPCKSQAERFTSVQKKEYQRMINSADESVLISEEYTSDCMRKRNEYLVDNSSVIISYLRRNFGGTLQTVNYARKKGIKIISL